MVRFLAAATLVGLLATGAAFAQTNGNDAANNGANSPPAAAAGTSDKTAAGPVTGPFTESEARSRIEAFGYTGVSELKEDGQSIWHGKATKDGKQVTVSVDNQGNTALSHQDIAPVTK